MNTVFVLSWQLFNAVCICLSILSARGEGRHCELQSGHHGQDSQPPSQLYVCGAVTPPPTHACALKATLKDVKLSSVSIPLSGFSGWLDEISSECFLCIPVCQLDGWDEEQTCVVSRPWPAVWIFSRDDFFGWLTKKETGPQFLVGFF